MILRRCYRCGRLSARMCQCGRGSTARGYGYAWQRVRAQVLASAPECELCGRPATDVDHILPKVRGGTDDPSNLRPLCRPCHLTRTAADNKKRARRHGQAR